MDNNIGCVQAPPLAPVMRKEKKKQAKDELDRIKQAEKKKRRLEKALATSAAIISELEKKKQKKKEEQQRLDEEGAAIAEAVALRVLHEDADDSCEIMLNKNEASNAGVFMGGWKAGRPYQSFSKYSVEGLQWVSDAYGSECKWNDWGISRSLSPGMYFEEKGRGAEISAGLIAAQAVSSLQIGEDARAAAFTNEGMATIFMNGMLDSSGLVNKVNLRKKV
ncbi:uncharacterized protein LOC131249102 [Magnolia sinica]|uniref:uncharacterized protein LOC131249102 n=1 Tax=Magnolia sinica TaxID=86752 RepID=UPI00265AD921|nr:uncharacterized protein LOC131249102 [Magnolia sinica]XP_058105651.1 uncharacterized protein LOC131249102 [Magnolia sinica]